MNALDKNKDKKVTMKEFYHTVVDEDHGKPKPDKRNKHDHHKKEKVDPRRDVHEDISDHPPPPPRSKLIKAI